MLTQDEEEVDIQKEDEKRRRISELKNLNWIEQKKLHFIYENQREIEFKIPYKLILFLHLYLSFQRIKKKLKMVSVKMSIEEK
jgi:hypothetical protein